jgi:hypothetical protein
MPYPYHDSDFNKRNTPPKTMKERAKELVERFKEISVEQPMFIMSHNQVKQYAVKR